MISNAMKGVMDRRAVYGNEEFEETMRENLGVEPIIRKKGKITLYLKRAARKTGGDRYESKNGFTIYIPQTISRPEGVIKDVIEVTFEPVE